MLLWSVSWARSLTKHRHLYLFNRDNGPSASYHGLWTDRDVRQLCEHSGHILNSRK